MGHVDFKGAHELRAEPTPTLGLPGQQSPQTEAGGLNIKRLLQLKENQVTQVSSFLCTGSSFQESGLTEIIPLIAPQLSGASILCFHILHFLKTHYWEWLQSNGCWMAGVLSFLSSLRAHRLTICDGCNR